MEFCTSGSGVELNPYNVLRIVNNGLRAAAIATKNSWNYMATHIYLYFPNSSWVFPIVEDGVVTLTDMPAKKFWALRISLGAKDESLISQYTSITLPFPKQSIDVLWHALVSPYDYYIEGSEYWPYVTEAGEITQGIVENPDNPRKFGILSDGPAVIKDVIIFGLIVSILYKSGLLQMAQSFFNSVCMKYKNWKMSRKLDSIDDKIEEVMTLTRVVESSTETDTQEIKDFIDSRVGVRLILK